MNQFLPPPLRTVHAFVATLLLLLAHPGLSPAAAPAPVSIEDERRLEQDLRLMRERLTRIHAASNPDHFADVDVFRKGVTWAQRYETGFTPDDLNLVRRSIARGMQRADELLVGQAPWTRSTGRVLRGFVSAVDGSTQPYGMILPRTYDGSRPMRLDVVLHGSSKPSGLSELRFGARFDAEESLGDPAAPDSDFIELHPLGRVENCYRWAGETDVFEAIEAACRNYRIDRDRIVLRGMSMGASGTWHLGLKHPDRFVALGPYCGYVDTHQFSETPVPGFIRVGQLPPHQERTLHMLDSVDYAANAGVVPAVAAIGDKDVFFQAHVLMGEAFTREGLSMVNLISPGTGHVVDPLTHRDQMQRIERLAQEGLNPAPKELRFVTWTLKYNRCHWIELLALDRHYERSEIVARVAEDGSVEVSLARNIRQFALHQTGDPGSHRVRIEGTDVALPRQSLARAASPQVFTRDHGRWRYAGSLKSASLRGKRPGLQGPIDDAFTAPFLCVRGTGTPWNPAVGAWADASLRRFIREWACYMRGDPPVKDDNAVTSEDLRTRNLILFGDPGSNRWIRKALPGLPLSWSRQEVRIGNETHPAGTHAPAMICASPLPGAADRYLVLNSGHTFHENEFASLNYLLFPRLGDWAIMKALPGAESWQPPASGFPEEVVRAGFFNEAWRTDP